MEDFRCRAGPRGCLNFNCPPPLSILGIHDAPPDPFSFSFNFSPALSILRIRVAPAAFSVANVYKQDASPLFRLPQELRDQIYDLVFSAHQFVFTEPHRKVAWEARPREDRHALSLLLSCRRARDDIGDTWISKAWFDFLLPIALLNGIADIPFRKRSMIRLLLIRCPAVVVIPPNADVEKRVYSLSAALKMLPGLSLDLLVVQGTSYTDDDFLYGSGPTVDYTIVDELIAESDGWKVLHFLCPDSFILCWKAMGSVLGHIGPQPQVWNKVLMDKDGNSKNASVTIHRHTESRSDRPISEICTPYHQELPRGVSEANYPYVEDTFLIQPDQQMNEMHIVARRGEGVVYEVDPSSPWLYFDIREDYPGMSWRQIRERYTTATRVSKRAYGYPPYSAVDGFEAHGTGFWADGRFRAAHSIPEVHYHSLGL
ncbi:hypothetical protein GE09DRAFT_1185116 [Coniochaeta sp. 2T2.1]|nr:hypothetical protein GE09DRAFT_1185116 [Coniochaeta sp. 2T2.1]